MIRVVHPGSRILDPDTDFLPCRIPDPGVKKAPNPGSWIRIRNTNLFYGKWYGSKNIVSRVQFYNILSTYNEKIKIILYTFLKFDKKN